MKPLLWYTPALALAPPRHHALTPSRTALPNIPAVNGVPRLAEAVLEGAKSKFKTVNYRNRRR